jgi:nitroimidazol reductase NimA-like FMN-containing flavoprotein (pyridoxamine 5'-phosphate oxidase superfamily)
MDWIDEPMLNHESKKKPTMERPDADIRENIQKLVNQQNFAILCTQGKNQPYGSIIAYAYTDDLKTYYFTTSVATRKFRLLTENPHVALVIDSRCQHMDDMTKVEALTITGRSIHITAGDEFEQGIHYLQKRHHYLHDFIKSPSTALIKIDVIRYFYVTRFQEVSQWVP